MCHEPLVPRLVASLQLLNYKHLESYDPTVASPTHSTRGESNRYTALCIRRWKIAAKQTPSGSCRQWLESSVSDLLSKHPELETSSPPRTDLQTPMGPRSSSPQSSSSKDTDSQTDTEDPNNETRPEHLGRHGNEKTPSPTPSNLAHTTKQTAVGNNTHLPQSSGNTEPPSTTTVENDEEQNAVSYTHLTLPTILLV